LRLRRFTEIGGSTERLQKVGDCLETEFFIRSYLKVRWRFSIDRTAYAVR